MMVIILCFSSSSIIRHTRVALVTGVQTCALPIYPHTGLPDRRSALDLLRRKIGRSENFSVALCDVDHFRIYNARHTALVGDAALRLLAEILTRTLRPDDVVARHDGEQFLLILGGVPTADAVKALERVREALVITQATRPEPAFTV